jgi:CO/xanthine dehydrogenase Mo-binding subunit
MKKRGKGISSIGYATGFFGGGDPNQAEISIKIDGTFDLVMGTSDIGQGCKTAYRQIAAEVLVHGSVCEPHNICGRERDHRRL